MTSSLLASTARRSSCRSIATSLLRGHQKLYQKVLSTPLSSSSQLSNNNYFGNTNGVAANNKNGNLPLNRWFSSYPPHEVVGLPALSPTMETGTIARWNKEEGEAFAAGDVFCEVETDKATVDFEAQDDGIVARILAQAGGGDVGCGEPIMITVEDEDHVAAFKDYVVEAVVAPTPAAATPAEPVPEPVASPTPVQQAATTPAAAPGRGSAARLFASPLAQKIALEQGIDLSLLSPGTGPNNRIIADDVREYVPSATAAAAVPAAAAVTSAASTTLQTPTTPMVTISGAGGYSDYPISDSAREQAARLTSSKQNVPHFHLSIDVTLDSILKLRSDLNAALGNDSETSISVNDLLIKASAAAMKTVPTANASWMNDVVRVFNSVNINVAVGKSPGDGLYTPLLRNVGGMGVAGISSALSDIVNKEDSWPPSAEDCAMGTFTVVNLGMYGIKSAAPIIVEPQVCILALGAAEARIVPNDGAGDDDEIYKESIMLTATLGCDHRVVDGAVGAQWLSAFKNHVENPTTLLL
mmetsp:Transcript_47769/g.48186  ORF Transcript_47769/g.48186 Transcript_47769/m.48186 type:complete len:527 (-) Transcript_47769:125-1705(-)